MIEGHSVAMWLTKRLPVFLILEPERVFIGFAAFVIGLTAFWFPARSASLQDSYNAWYVLLWGITLIVGGLAKMTGLYMSAHVREGKSKEYELTARSLERMGASLIALGASIFASVMINAYGFNAAITVILFIALAAANTVRVIISAAGREILNRSGGDNDHV